MLRINRYKYKYIYLIILNNSKWESELKKLLILMKNTGNRSESPEWHSTDTHCWWTQVSILIETSKSLQSLYLVYYLKNNRPFRDWPPRPRVISHIYIEIFEFNDL